MKKILYITDNLNRSESTLYFKDLVVGLEGKFEQTIWSSKDGQFAEDYEFKGIPVYINGNRFDKNFRKESVKFNDAIIEKIAALIQQCKKNKEKLAIICAGMITRKLLEEFNFSYINLVGIFEDDPELAGGEIQGYNVYPLSDIDKFDVTSVLIAHNKPELIKKNSLKMETRVIDDIFTVESGIEPKNKSPQKGFIARAFNISFLKPDYIVVDGVDSEWAVSAGKLLGKKVILVQFEPVSTEKLSPEKIAAIKKADFIVAPFNYVLDSMGQHLKREKAKLIPLGIDFNHISKYKSINSPIFTRKKLRIPDDYKIVSNINPVRKENGQLEFVKAAVNYLNTAEDKKVIFLIVGGRLDEYSEEIFKVVENSEYWQNFVIIPATRTVYKFFNLSDVCVISTKNNVFPYNLFRIMAFGKSVIVTNTTGVNEIIVNNEHGLIIDRDNLVEDLETSMRELIEKPGFRYKYSKNAYAKFANNYTMTKFTKKYLKLFNN